MNADQVAPRPLAVKRRNEDQQRPLASKIVAVLPLLSRFGGKATVVLASLPVTVRARSSVAIPRERLQRFGRARHGGRDGYWWDQGCQLGQQSLNGARTAPPRTVCSEPSDRMIATSP